MNITHPKLKAAVTSVGGPGEYFMRSKDSRGKPRDPAPQKLFGNPQHFDALARGSRSRHPHLHAVISYRGEPHLPAENLRNAILEMYVNLLLGGLARNKVYCLAVRHGDHDHLAIFRHLIDPRWPRFQPYYHEADKYLRSEFQWLVNLRYGLRAPENPHNSQLISVATRYFRQIDVEFVRDLRVEISDLVDRGTIVDHASFISHLQDGKGWKVEIMRPRAVEEDDAETNRERRSWLRITTKAGEIVQIKGPICSADFKVDTYNVRLAQQQQKYESFIGNPGPLWDGFVAAMKRRRARNAEMFPRFCDAGLGELSGFGDLNPSLRAGRTVGIGPELS